MIKCDKNIKYVLYNEKNILVVENKKFLLKTHILT